MRLTLSLRGSRRSTLGIVAVAALVGAATLGSSWVISGRTGELARRNAQAFQVARTTTAVAELHALGWGGVAGRVLRAEEIDALETDARAAVHEIRGHDLDADDDALAAEIDELVVAYSDAMRNGQRQVRSRGNPESGRGLEPYPQYPLINQRLAELAEHVNHEAEALSGQARLLTVATAIASFGTVLVALAAYARHRQAATRREMRSAADAHFAALVREAPDIVLVLDRGGFVQYESPSVQRVLGLEEGVLAGKSVVERVHPEDRATVRHALEGLSPGDQVEVEVRARHSDGSWRAIAATVADLLGDPLVEGYVVNAHDVTEQRRLEADLRQAASHLGHVLGSTPDMLLELDIRGPTLRLLNRDLFLGHDRSVLDDLVELAGLVHPADAGATRAWWNAAGLSAGDEHLDLRMRTAAGDWEWLRIQTRSLGVAVDGSERLLVSMTPISAEVEAEAQRRQLEEQLRQSTKLQAVGQLAGGIAHDFNNILCAIQAFADLAMDEIDDPAVLDDLGEIKTASRRGADLVSQIMAFSRIELDSVEPIDLGSVVSESARMIERTLDASAELELRLDPERLGVLADPIGLEQVVLNLVVNARDAMGGVGRLVVGTESVSLDEASARLVGDLAAGTYALLTVIDRGCGIAPEVLGRVFEPFFTTKEAGKGTGLGLATVYGIVRRAGGAISIDSVPGSGTTVRVYLPLVELTDVAEAEDARRASADGAVIEIPAGSRILLVEDERAVRVAVGRTLADAGCEVTSCQDGPAALEVLRSSTGFDLLLTDVVMPGGLSGLDVAAAARERVEGIAVVYMSGYSADAVANRGVVEPGVPVLHKPVTRRELLSEVARAVSRSGVVSS